MSYQMKSRHGDRLGNNFFKQRYEHFESTPSVPITGLNRYRGDQCIFKQNFRRPWIQVNQLLVLADNTNYVYSRCDMS